MTPYALVRDGRVVEVVSSVIPLAATFPGVGWHDATGVTVTSRPVAAGDAFDGTGFGPPVAPAALPGHVRAVRDHRLGLSDWTQMPDAPLAPAAVAGWRAYRQALRDMPSQAGFPHDVAWPEPPA